MSEQHTVLSKAATTMSVARLGFGAWQAYDLLHTPPEERTVGDALLTAGVASTDKGDGKASDHFGSTKHGPLWDQLADISFSVGGEVALGLNGEISPIHPILSVAREAVVHSMRIAANTSGQEPISVGSRGKQKTAMKMLMMTTARSPVSQNGDVLESMASFGTALSLISGADYAQTFFAGRKRNEVTDTVRNGGFRKASASPNQRIVEWIHKNKPGIMPDHLTIAGEALVELSIITALARPKWGVALAIGPYTLGGLIDGIDGGLSRVKGISSLKGMLKDVRADKRQEIATSIVNSRLASRNGNHVAASQYGVASMTAALPAYFRAAAEAKGHIVSEDASGSRVIRGIEGGVGIGLNGNEGVSNVVSALLVTGNVLTSAQRADVVMRGADSPHYRGANGDPELMRQAAARRDALLPIAIGGFAIGSALLANEYRLVRAENREEVAEEVPEADDIGLLYLEPQAA
ncbi:MAG: CDP-alcohol phosphatidyltransferase family protein [Candidatus Saccharimonadales bacterium]